MRRCRITSASHNKGSGRSNGRLPSVRIHSTRLWRRIFRSSFDADLLQVVQQAGFLGQKCPPAAQKARLQWPTARLPQPAIAALPAIVARSGIVPKTAASLASDPGGESGAAQRRTRIALTLLPTAAARSAFVCSRRNAAAFNGTPSNYGVSAQYPLSSPGDAGATSSGI